MSTELSTAAIEECLFAPFTTARDEFDALLAEIAALRNDLKREVYEAKFLELQAENAALRTLISEMRLTFDAHKEREVSLENKNVMLREQLASAEQRLAERERFIDDFIVKPLSAHNMTCKWVNGCDYEYDYERTYDTECSHVFYFTDGNVKDNGFIFCPYCGKKIIVEKAAADNSGKE